MQHTSDDWTISSNSLPQDAESIMRSGTVYQLANGYMGYRGTLDEYTSRQQVGCTLAGLYDQVGEAWREPVNAPNAGFTQVWIQGMPVHALESRVLYHSQSVCMRDAVFARETGFQVGNIGVHIRSRRFLSLTRPHLLCVEYSVQCDHDCGLEILTGIDTDIWDLNGPHLQQNERKVQDSIYAICARTHEQGKQVVVTEQLHCPVGAETPIRDHPHLHGRCIKVESKAGQVITLHKYVAIVTSNDVNLSAVGGHDLLASCRHWGTEAADFGFEACLLEQREAWRQRWARCDVQIEGDTEAQLALRYSLFQLLMVAPVQGSANSIPARALSGQVYKGAIFWDTEFFMLPFFLHTQPEVAEDLLRYRIRTLEGARRKARSEGTGYSGAFYAWESQDTGDEACTYFNVGDPFTGRNLRTHFRDRQIHISGDVALAFWDHFEHTGQDHLLREGGAEVIFECARFYASWLYFKPGKNRYEVLDVIGPDEYHERVHNNAFTNKIVHRTLQVALSVHQHFSHTDPQWLEALITRLQLHGDLEDFAIIEKQLYLPQPDASTGIIEQFDGYYQLEDASLEQVKSRKILPNEYLGAGQGVAAHTRIIKQADVVMMLHHFKSEFDADILRANWEYYEPRTEHGSSLSACAYAIVAAACGKVDWAYRYFLKTAKVDLEANYKMYAGTTFIGGSHPAANGGSWMAAIFGFAGLEIREKQVHLDPRLPMAWGELRFPFTLLGGRFTITITPDQITLEAASANPQPVSFRLAEHTLVVAAGDTRTAPYSQRNPSLQVRDH